jgi:hypothetical protein
MNIELINELKRIPYKPNVYVGSNTKTWCRDVFGEESSIYTKFDIDKKLNRSELADITNSGVYNLDLKVIAILSWGGMRRNHARELFAKDTSAFEDIERIQKAKDRKNAFKEYMSIREQGLTKGLGIAYFTKLIWFLTPVLKGYIMDQWLAKSVNLIYGKEIVHISNNWVSDKNTEHNYETYCQCVEEIAKQLNCEPQEAEERMFSHGGRNKGEWRKKLL